MTATILLQGRLERAPEQRVSRSGNPFTMATLRVSAGNELQFWKLFVFSESAQTELLCLSEGDALAVQGAPKFEIYRPEGGEPRVSLSVTADHILALRQPPRERKEAADARNGGASYTGSAPAQKRVGDTRSGLARHAGERIDDLNDDILF